MDIYNYIEVLKNAKEFQDKLEGLRISVKTNISWLDVIQIDKSGEIHLKNGIEYIIWILINKFTGWKEADGEFEDLKISIHDSECFISYKKKTIFYANEANAEAVFFNNGKSVIEKTINDFITNAIIEMGSSDHPMDLD